MATPGEQSAQAADGPYREALDVIPMTRSTVTVLGGTTHFWTYGPTDAARTILLVHGFRGDHHGLEPVIAQMPDVRFVAPDLPGFGESTVLPGREHDLRAFVEWLNAFRATVGLDDDAVVLGHSFGSIVSAAAVAAGMPTSAMILINPIAAPALQGPRGVMTRLAVFYYWASAALPSSLGFALLRSKAIVRVMSVTMAKTTDKPLRRWIHAEHGRYFSAFADRDSLLQSFRASVANDVSDQAAMISVPTLLVAAERDDITRVSAQHSLREQFPDAELVVIPDVGHLIHYETPAAAAAAVREFLGRRLPLEG
jgi:pimeloyl-ACP methyl ester carboxylesterase